MKITLKAARVNAGLSPKQAADKIGCAVMTLFRWEKNPSNIRIRNQQKIADAYVLSVENLKWQND